MAFFLIMPSVMVVSILLVHGVASHFGMQLKYKALALCAPASVAISFVSIRTSPFLNKMFLIKIVGLIVLSSLILAALNRFLVKRSEQSKVEPEVEPKEPPIIIVRSSREPAPSTEEEAVKRRVDEIKAIKAAEEPIVEKPQSRSLVQLIKEDREKSDADKKIRLKKPDKKVDAPPVAPIVEKKSVEKKVEPPTPAPKKNSPPVAPVADKKISREQPKGKKPAPTSTVDQNAVSGLVAANEKISVVIDKRKSTKPASTSRTSFESRFTDEELQEVDSHLHSLDEILDFAYSQKNAGNFKLSILAYQKALDRYRADDYAPFIAIDLSSIYKEQAAYTKAIKVCEDALTLPAVVRSASARKDFSNSLAYLRTVQAVLSKHRVLSTPFSKIPRNLLLEIDADFKKLTVLS